MNRSLARPAASHRSPEGSAAAAPPARSRGAQARMGNAFLADQLASRPTEGKFPFQAELEQSFGEDFSGVKVQAGRAGDLRSMGAAAMAGPGESLWLPSAPSKEQVAHELAHVVQQRRGSPRGLLSRPGDSAEREAEAAARGAAAGRPVQVSQAPTGRFQGDWLEGAGWGAGIGGLLGGLPGAVVGGAVGAGIGAWMGEDEAVDPGFQKATEGGVSAGDAPEQVVLPTELQEEMSEAWEDSFEDGKSKERGGIYAQDDDGDYSYYEGDTSDGGSFTPNFEDLDSDEKARVLFHTHPYDESEGGHTDVSFSGPDLANLVYQDVPFKLVQSGEGQFGVMKSKEFEDRVKGLDGDGKKALSDEMKAAYKEALSKSKGSLKERVAAANRAVCQKYQLPYYEGSGGTLSKVDTGK